MRIEERRDLSCLNDRIGRHAFCWNGQLSVPMERGGLGDGVGCSGSRPVEWSMWLHDLAGEDWMSATTLWLVVGFTGRFQAGLIDHSTGPVGGPSDRSVGTDRVPAQRGFCLPAVEACWRNGDPAVLGWGVPLERSCRAGSVGSVRARWVGSGGGSLTRLNLSVRLTRSPGWAFGWGRAHLMKHSSNGMSGFREALSLSEAFDWNESMFRSVRRSPFADRLADGGWRRLGVSRGSRAGPKSRHRKTSNPAGGTCAVRASGLGA